MVIEIVHSMAEKQKQPEMPGRNPTFELTYNESHDDFEEEESENESGDNEPYRDDLVLEAPMVSDDSLVDEDEVESENDSNQDDGSMRSANELQNVIDDEETTIDRINDEENNESENLMNECVDRNNSGMNENEQHVNSNESNESFEINEEDYAFNIHDACESSDDSSYDEGKEMEVVEIPSTNEGATRPKRECAGAGVKRLEPSLYGKEYTESISKQCMMHNLPIVRRLVHFVMTQMSVKKGFRKFGNRAVASMISELKQLHAGAMEGKPVVAPVWHKDTTAEQRRKALEAVGLIKEKRSGKIKGRVCANGKKQRWYLRGDEDFSSPTALLESITLTLVIEALEGRDVAVVDVPGAYLHAELRDESVLLVLRGELVDIMCQVDEEYRKYIVVQKGKKVLCLKVLRALCGCLESALLWHELCSTTLTKMGFTLNPCDNCVANEMINGHQCTVAFYVDDNKISHRDPEVVTSVTKELSVHFGELQVQRGNKFDILGMDVEIKNKKVYISMVDHLKNAVETYEEGLGLLKKRVPATPGKGDLFNDGVVSEELNRQESEVFHSVTAKFLHICKRARLDIEPVVAYLCTRVSCSTENDREQLDRLVRCVKRTLNDVRIVGAKDIRTLLTWIDAAYAVYPNMRGQTGGTMSFGTGVIHGRSSKQKLNAKSSTEAEIIGVSEYVPFHTWVKNFLKCQGYDVDNNIMFQDNQSAIRLETNGRNSCTGNSRHIDIRYFFVKDRVDKGEVKIEYCNTDDMIADFFTKPLQGKLFRKFRDLIMGYVDFPDHYFNVTKIKERVEESKNEQKDSNENDSKKTKKRDLVIYGNKRNDELLRRKNKKNERRYNKNSKIENEVILNDTKNNVLSKNVRNTYTSANGISSKAANGSEIKKSFASKNEINENEPSTGGTYEGEKKGRTNKYSNGSRVTYVDDGMRGD